MKQVVFTAFTCALIATGATAQTMPGSALLLLDTDSDNRVTLDEFNVGMGAMFDQMDANKSRQLEFGEVESFVPRDIFDAADSDANGRLSKAEYEAQTLKDYTSANKDGDTALD